MREAIALVRANWISARSYRLSLLLSVGSVVFTAFPLFFVAGALQPIMAESIRTEGGQYFAFLLVGMISYSFLAAAVNTLPAAVGSGISTGTLEALLSTRASLPSLLVGLVGYGFAWTAVRGGALLGAGWALGAQVEWSRAAAAAVVLLMIVCAYLPFGLIAAAMVLAFRTAGPLPQAVLVLSGLLGGVYYPTRVIPSWIEDVSAWIPLTYGLRALRQTLLEGLPLRGVAADLGILSGFILLLLAIGAAAFAAALNYARRSGTLAQY